MLCERTRPEIIKVLLKISIVLKSLSQTIREKLESKKL